MKHLTPSFSLPFAASLLLAAGSAFAEQPTDEQATEKYQGFAEGNPALTDDRGNRLQKKGADPSAATDPAGAEPYPEGVAEGNDPLTPDLEDQAPPYSDEADVHGEFGDQNPDVQR